MALRQRNLKVVSSWKVNKYTAYENKILFDISTGSKMFRKWYSLNGDYIRKFPALFCAQIKPWPWYSCTGMPCLQQNMRSVMPQRQLICIIFLSAIKLHAVYDPFWNYWPPSLWFPSFVHVPCCYKEQLLLQPPLLATSVDSCLETASITRHLAAPLKATSAVRLLTDLTRVVATAAAQQLTPFHPGGGRIALASLRPQGTCFPIRFAEIWRVFGVDEVATVWRFYGVAFGYETAAVVARDNLCCTIEPLLEAVTYVSERRHLAPASAHRAGSWQTMALAFRPHEVLHCLEQQMSFTFSNLVSNVLNMAVLPRTEGGVVSSELNTLQRWITATRKHVREVKM